MNLCWSLLSSSSWRLTTSKRVAGVLLTCWSHNWPLSFHSLFDLVINVVCMCIYMVYHIVLNQIYSILVVTLRHEQNIIWSIIQKCIRVCYRVKLIKKTLVEELNLEFHQFVELILYLRVLLFVLVEVKVLDPQMLFQWAEILITSSFLPSNQGF